MMSFRFSLGSVPAPKRRQDGSENQDACAHDSNENFAVLAVADGAGSLPKSGTGASIAASTAVGETLDALDCGLSLEEALRRGFESARDALMSRPDSKEIGATLVVAAMSADAWGILSVGDSFGVITFRGGSMDLVTSERESEFANITKLLTSSNISPAIVTGDTSIRVPEVLFLASDGMASPTLTPQGQPSAKFWNPVSNGVASGEMDVQDLIEFMDSGDRLSDDTTMVALIPAFPVRLIDVASAALDDNESADGHEDHDTENDQEAEGTSWDTFGDEEEQPQAA